MSDRPAAGAPPAATVSPRLRLDYLDGIRALCALLVLFGHVGDGGFFAQGHVSVPLILRPFLALFTYDRYAVAIFIILSGYCLMLPVARTPEGTLPGGIRGFFKRRARRILPPYYAALVLALCIPRVVPYSGPPPPWDAGSIGAHLLLVHNLFTRWMFSIDGVMWSVGTEVDIYVLFALLLLPLYRKLGMAGVIVVAFAIGMAPHFLLHKWLDPVAPWYVGLFALGMAAALVSFSPQPTWRRLQADLPWAWFAGTLSVMLVIAFLLKPAWLTAYPYYITEPLVGIAAVCGLIHYTRLVVTETGASSPLLRLLESPWLVRMGLFSYSIYLMHSPLLDAPVNVLHLSAWSPHVKFLALWLVVLPLVLLGCYLFHLAFERPFMPRRSDQRILHSQREPAP